MNGPPDYSVATGDEFRWPDVLDRWHYWVWESRHVAVLCKLIDVTDTDLRVAIHGVLPDTTDEHGLRAAFAIAADAIDRRTAEYDWTIANTIDAAVAEQARRSGVAADDRRLAPRPDQSDGLDERFLVSPFRGRAHYDREQTVLTGADVRRAVAEHEDAHGKHRACRKGLCAATVQLHPVTVQRVAK